MRYHLREKIFAIGDDFEVKDEHGRTAFYIDGKVFTLRKTLLLLDADKRELATIRKQILSWGPTYDILVDGRSVAEVRKHVFTLFRAKFTVDVEGPDDLEATGSFLEHEYIFRRGWSVVAVASKRWVSLSHTYTLDIADGENAALIVAAAVVIDLCSHDAKHD